MGKRNHGAAQHTHICSCGKKAYSTKKTAKRAARTCHPGARLGTYQCDRSASVSPAWHYGHVDLYVRDLRVRAGTPNQAGGDQS